MKIQIIDNGFLSHADLLKRKIGARIDAESAPGGMTVSLSVDPRLSVPESYRISCENGVWHIKGSDEAGLYFGIGKFLRSAEWSETGFLPKETGSVVSPDCPFRCIYFSVHFFNFYYTASQNDLKEYLEDLILYGYNAIDMIIPVLNFHSFDDEVFLESVRRTRFIYQESKKLGLKLAFNINPNQGLLSAPHEFDADLSYERNPKRPYRGTAGRNLCPNKPGASEYLRGLVLRCLEQYEDIGLDYIILWPYDEGGCGCEKCAPWGANGFDKISRVIVRDAKRLYPDLKVIYSTWTFDVPDDQKEYSTLYKRLSGGEMDYVDYLMTDAHGWYPKYVLEHPVVRPIVNFPEISMWGLYPWGGFGANPLPKRFEKIWDSSKAVLAGGMPYSEGIFEDISKAQFSGYYWDRNARYSDVLAEYAEYEFGCGTGSDAVRLMELIEENHVSVRAAIDFYRAHPNENIAYEKQVLNLSAAKEGASLAKAIDEKLPERRKASWRWRILYIRAILDEKRYRAALEEGLDKTPDGIHMIVHDREIDQILKNDSEAQALYQELRSIYRTLDHDNGMNRWTLPVVQGHQ